MSTTTNFKRIALVAVAALGFGVLSAIPSTAAVSGVVTTVTNGATTLRSGSTTLVDADTGTGTGATIAITALISTATDSVTVAFFNKNTLSTSNVAYLGLVETTTSVISRVSNTGSNLATHSAATKINGTMDSSTSGVTTFMMNSSSGTGNIGATFALFLDTRTATGGAGTYTYTVIVKTSTVNSSTVQTTEYATDVSIVVAAGSGVSTTPSAAFTNAYIAASASAAADATISPTLATASTTAAAYINVFIKNASDTQTAQDTVTVSIAGAGLMYDGSSYGKSLTGYQTGLKSYSIVPDGGAGTSTVTITLARTGQTFTKSMTFYAAASATNTLVASVYHPVLGVGSNNNAVRVVAKDGAGNTFSGAIYLYASTAADALIAGSNATPVLCTYSPTGLRHDCNVSTTLTGTAKLKAINASTVALATATSNEITVTVRNAPVATVKLSFDKATYAPNERAQVRVLPLDAAGLPLAAATYTNLFTTGGISTTSGITGDTLTAVSVTTQAATSSTTQGAGSAYVGTNANHMTYYVFMPAAGGTVTLTATGGTSLPLAGQVAVTASATVTDNAAAALAAVTALATTVASLKTLITTLTNLVLKIQKKVKA